MKRKIVRGICNVVARQSGYRPALHELIDMNVSEMLQIGNPTSTGPNSRTIAITTMAGTVDWALNRDSRCKSVAPKRRR